MVSPVNNNRFLGKNSQHSNYIRGKLINTFATVESSLKGLIFIVIVIYTFDLRTQMYFQYIF